MLMLDLFAGLGGASLAMRERGWWDVITVDIEPKFNTTIVADLTTWHYDGPQPDLLWASPPCIEFAREFMPWSKTGKTPDISLITTTLRLVNEIRPKFWVLENVVGAQRWIGRAPNHIGPFYLWGFYPKLNKVRLLMRKKESYGSKDDAKRAMIPYVISEAVANAVERELGQAL